MRKSSFCYRFRAHLAAVWSQAEVHALRDARVALADDVRVVSTLIHPLRTALVGAGLIMGGA